LPVSTRAPHGHVLADLGNQLVQVLADSLRTVGILRGLDRTEFLADLQRNLRNRLDERLELVVARNKVGLDVHLHHRRAPLR
jgi:hypothetical protein